MSRASTWHIDTEAIFGVGADVAAEVQANGGCVGYWGGPGMWPSDGAPISSVNGIGIPTHVIQGQFFQTSVRVNLYTSHAVNHNAYTAPFPNTLLKEGPNRVEGATFGAVVNGCGATALMAESSLIRADPKTS